MSGKSTKEDTPKSCKRHTRSRNSFRFGAGKSKGLSASRSSTGSGKTVTVQGHSRLENLEKKQEEVVRALKFHEDAVSKDIPDYLQGTATILLENIIYLSKDLEQVLHECNSPDVSRLKNHLCESVADLLRWSDQFHLRGPECDSTQSKVLSEKVKEAVKNLVEFAINKENQNISNPDFYNSSNKNRESNSSYGSEDSPHQGRRSLNNKRSEGLHGSLPEIPLILNGSATGDQQSYITSDQLSSSNKLSHSLSSDSILDSKDNESFIANSINSASHFGSNNSLSEAPPIPPKKHKNRTPLSASNELSLPSLGRQISPIPPPSLSLHDSVDYSNRSLGSTCCSSTPRSLDRSSSPSHSHDSFNRSFEDKFTHFSISSFDQSSSDMLANMSLPSSSLSYVGDSLFNQDLPQFQLSASSSPNYSSAHGKSFFNQATECSSVSIQKKSFSQEVNSQMRSCVSSSTTQQHLVIHRSSRSSTCSSSTSSSRSSGVEGESNIVSMTVPPPIPTKLRNKSERAPSQYDNIPCSGQSDMTDCRHESPCRAYQIDPRFPHLPLKKQPFHIIGSRSSSDSGCSTLQSSPAGSSVALGRFEEHFEKDFSENKPPLPLKKLKKKRIMDYLEFATDYQGLPERRSQQMMYCHQSHTFDQEICTSTRLSLPVPAALSDRPALPPKRRIQNRERSPASADSCNCSCRMVHDEMKPITCPPLSPNSTKYSVELRSPSYQENEVEEFEVDDTATYLPRSPSPPSEKEYDLKETNNDNEKFNDEVLSSFDVSAMIKTDPNNNDGEDVLEGTPESLLVYATYAKNEKFLNAFLTTYRTFLTPGELIRNLIRRYELFCDNCNAESEKATKNSYSLLLRVVHELNVADENEYALLPQLSNFEYSLLTKGELRRALCFRKELTEKIDLKKRYSESIEFSNYPSIAHKNAQHCLLLDFKTHELAEQMTLIEAELFEKVGISEALQWARAQNPEKCPNLCTFTNHFNDVSYWVRTQILQSNSHDREKYLKKFIKIMKHFRKINNFSSGLAIWAAISSVCIERLGWQQSMLEELREHETFFKLGYSSEYREALAEAKPPCLPCLATIVADLTSTHNGNSDFTSENKINFKKRWIQNKILKDFKRFNPCRYKFKKNETIIKFFNNFENCLDEDEQWKLSYKIKPSKPRSD